MLHGPPPAGPKPHGTAGLPPPFGETDIGERVTFVRMPFSVGSGFPLGLPVLGVPVLEFGASDGFSVRGLHATLMVPMPMIASALSSSADFRGLVFMVQVHHGGVPAAARFGVGPHRQTAPVLDLVLPLECGGCGAPATRWCPACAAALQVRVDEPQIISPRTDPGVPVFSLGRYAGPRRRAIVALKEHRRGDLVAPLARAVALGIHQLLNWGVLELPLAVVPAPTRWSAARRRGGDPVTRIAVAATAACPDLTVASALRMAGHVRDSVGLTSSARQHNIAGQVRLARAVTGEVLLVDDVITTGATARESVRALDSGGARVAAVLAVAHA